MGNERSTGMPGPRRVLAHPILETLTFRGVPPSEEILRVARELSEELRPLLGPHARCELVLASVRWLTRDEDGVEARASTTCFDAPVVVFEEGLTATQAIRQAFQSLQRVVTAIHEVEDPDTTLGLTGS